MPTRQSEYKPLLFTTTLRNPGRLKGLLNILSKFQGEVLTNEAAEKIMGEIIRYGLYRPTRGVTKIIENKWGGKRITDQSAIGLKLLDNIEVSHLLEHNPQNHKEAGFNKGWPSRFATIFDLAKELGFVYYWQDTKIEFSEIGLKLAQSIDIVIKEDLILFEEIHPEFEQQAFLQAMVKYQRNNPFVRVLNENAPLILLLNVINKINSDKELNGTGISKLELPLVIFWKDNDAEKLYKRIKKIRKEYGYNPSWEVIVDICLKEIMGGNFKKFNPKSIMGDYPDEFIRKMRLTGLISLRGAGRFIDINRNEQKKVDYALANYSNYKKYSTEKEYFGYMAKVDGNLITITSKQISNVEREQLLSKWLDVYSWDQIKEELVILAKKRLTKDEVLKYLSSPTRLEFLVSLAIKSKFPNVRVVPNYPYDDEGLPTSTAGGIGDKGDIECFENTNGILVEVTMSEGRIQTVMEVWPISRHLEKFNKAVKNSMCYFIAPSIFADSRRQIDYVKDKEKLEILPKTIEQFLGHVETANFLYSVA